MKIFLVSDLYTWIRTTPSSCKVYRNLFLMPKLEFPSQNTYTLTYMINFWVSDLHTWNLDQDDYQQDPAAARCPEIYFWCKIWYSHLKDIKFDIHDHFLDKWPLYLDQDGSQQDPAAGVQKFIFHAEFGISTQKT